MKTLMERVIAITTRREDRAVRCTIARVDDAGGTSVATTRGDRWILVPGLRIREHRHYNRSRCGRIGHVHRHGHNDNGVTRDHRQHCNGGGRARHHRPGPDEQHRKRQCDR